MNTAEALMPVFRVIQKMSSREIAELVKSRHDNVKRTIERLAESAVIGVPPMEEYLDSLGRKATEYLLDKRSSLIVVAQLSPQFTAVVVDRWQELESRSDLQLPDFCNPVMAARAWAEQYEQRLQSEMARKQLAAVNAELAPKAELHDVVTQATNCQTIEAAAKVLGWGRNRLFDFLRKERILIAGSTLPYQRFVDSGHFRVIEIAFTKRNGESGTSTKTLVTGKGLVLIQKRISPQVMLQAGVSLGRDLVN